MLQAVFRQQTKVKDISNCRGSQSGWHLSCSSTEQEKLVPSFAEVNTHRYLFCKFIYTYKNFHFYSTTL